MHVYFSGIGGAGIGPLALIAHQAGYVVSGSDKQPSAYLDYLKSKGIRNIHIGQDKSSIEKAHAKNPIDWLVFSSAVFIESPDHPELAFAREKDIKATKRDEFTNKIVQGNNLKLIAVAGTHGKTTTTAMAIWLMQHLFPLSYLVGAKIPFGDMGKFDASSEYFVYECDEFDRNFLAFYPYEAIVTGIDHDHHEIYPSFEDYKNAFKQFLSQATNKVVWQSDADGAGLKTDASYLVLDDNDKKINTLSIAGHVNRRDGWQVIKSIQKITNEPEKKLIRIMSAFPGVSRRFEKITDNLYSDYAHTIPKIKGCLQMAGELSDNVVVVYEPLTNRRQHHIKDDYKDIFSSVKKLYWVPSYLAREDPKQKVLSPSELIKQQDSSKNAEPAKLNAQLKSKIKEHLRSGDLVVCMSGGGGGSLDEWLRKQFKPS